MSKVTHIKQNESDNWDKYWSGVASIGAFSDGGVSHPAITAYWQHFFSSLSDNNGVGALKVIDIASGNGALIEAAVQVFGDHRLEFTSLDLSPAAILQLTTRFPFVKGLVANANAIPFQDNSVDMVLSQFGIEYAGDNAIEEAIRVVNHSGTVALMMHCDNGVIANECQKNLSVIKKVLDSQVLRLAKTLFESRTNLYLGGDKHKQNYQVHAQQFSLAIVELENIMTEFGAGAAGGFVQKLYNDLANMHEKFERYVLKELISWLNNTEIELDAYKGRMNAMLNASLDNEAFADLVNDFQAWGFSVITADKLYSPDSSIPLAWVFHAKKQDV